MRVYPYGPDGPSAEVIQLKGLVHVSLDKAGPNPGDVINATIASGHSVPDPTACAKLIKPEIVRGGWSFLPPNPACYSQEAASNQTRGIVSVKTSDYELNPVPIILIAGALITVGIIYLRNRFKKTPNPDHSIEFMPDTRKPDWKVNPDVVPLQIIPIPGHVSHQVEEHVVAESEHSRAWIFPHRENVAHCRSINGSKHEMGEPEDLPKEVVSAGQTILKNLSDTRDAANAQSAQDLLGYELW